MVAGPEAEKLRGNKGGSAKGMAVMPVKL